MLVTGIGQLVTNDAERGAPPLGVIPGAALVVDAGRIVWTGPQSQVPQGAGGERIDVAGACVLPGFVDAHTHLVFAGDRAEEFEARMAGHPYRAGGILTTVAASRAASVRELTARAKKLAGEALRQGTTTLEVKSGYGLATEAELRLLEAAGQIEEPALPRVERTFLGAHVVPPEYDGRPDDYVELVAGEMLDRCAPSAGWCDVFCDQGAFDGEQARRVLEAGAARGLGLRIHANQLTTGPGAQLAADLGATSADHLTHLTDADITALGEAGVVATLLPAAEFSTRSPYAPARKLAAAGVTLALATDCNPGTSYTTSMGFVIALACREMQLSAAEAVHAATAGGARSLRLTDVGHLREGAHADFVVLDAPSAGHLAYRPGVNLVQTVVREGKIVHACGG